LGTGGALRHVPPVCLKGDQRVTRVWAGRNLWFVVAVFLIVWPVSRADAQSESAQATPQTPQQVAAAAQQNVVTCESQPGQRIEGAANAWSGVALLRSTGSAACLLGKTWGYDDKGIWVSDGCSGQFYAGQLPQAPVKAKPFEHILNVGFLLYDGDKGQIYFRLFSYARYLNQRN